MSLPSLDSLLLSLVTSQSLGFQGLQHFIHTAHGSGSVLSKTLSLNCAFGGWEMGRDPQVLPLLSDPGERVLHGLVTQSLTHSWHSMFSECRNVLNTPNPCYD